MTTGRSGFFVFVLFCSFASYELFGVFIINNVQFVYGFFCVGKLCVVWPYCADLRFWTSIKNGRRLKFKYRKISTTLATKYLIFFLLFGVFG